MGLFWNKKIEPDRVIYTRSKRQKRTVYLFITIGFLLFLGVPTLLKNIPSVLEFSKRWPALFLVIIFFGAALIIFTGIYNFITTPKIWPFRKKFQYVATEEGETVTIEKSK